MKQWADIYLKSQKGHWGGLPVTCTAIIIRACFLFIFFLLQPLCSWCSGCLMRSSWEWRTSLWEDRVCLMGSGCTYRTWAESSRTHWEMSRKLPKPCLKHKMRPDGLKPRVLAVYTFLCFQGCVCSILPLPHSHRQKVKTDVRPMWGNCTPAPPTPHFPPLPIVVWTDWAHVAVFVHLFSIPHSSCHQIPFHTFPNAFVSLEHSHHFCCSCLFLHPNLSDLLSL